MTPGDNRSSFRRVAPLIAAAVAVLSAAPALGQSQYLICVDPGHGGADPGAVGCNLEEAEINLSTALKLRSLLQTEGFRVVMTRETDTTVELVERSSFANAQGATRFVSIHTNAGGGTGIETYCHTSATSSSNGWKLATLIQEEMIAAWPMRDRGMKQADYHVLRETNMPATLTELAFIDSPSCADAAYLSSGTHRDEAALAHLRAIQRHFGFPPSSGGGTTTTPGTARGVIFQDTGAGTADMSIRIENATVLVQETGATATTDASGNWSFSLDPGTYTIKASKAGFQDNQRSCTVTEGGTAWCSFGLFAASTPTKGTAKGVAFEDKGSGTADTTTRLAGATVTVQQTGASVVTDDSGNWTFELDAGTYTIRASKAGYQDGERTCEVTAGGTAWCSIGLFPATASNGTAKGMVYIDAGDGSREPLAGASVTVLETAAAATSGASGDYSFSLAAGSYTIKATMTGYSQNQVSCSVTSGQETTCDIGLVPESPGTGFAQGVVFLDKGDGSTQSRISGATVNVLETDAVATSNLSGEWRFELAPGSYTIHAEASGFDSADVSCQVVSGQSTDCSIGLVELTPDRPDAGSGKPDAGTATPDAGAQPVEPPEIPDGSCGCSTPGSEPAGLLLMALAGAALLRRRRGVANVAVAVVGIVLATGTSACTEQEQAAPRQAVVTAQNAQALETQPFIEVGEPQVLATGDWTAPVLSPQGGDVVFTRSGFEGLFLISSRGGEIRTLTEEKGAGYAPLWDREGARIGYRHPGQPFVESPVFTVDLQGNVAKPFALHQNVWALQRGDAVVLREGKSERIVAEGGDRFYAPFLTRDGKFLVYSGLQTGIWAYRRQDGAKVHLGKGSHPSVSEDGRFLVFTRTKDDGANVTSGDLFITDLADSSFRTAEIPLPGDQIALHPSFASGRGLLVYSTASGSIQAVKVTVK